MFLVGIPKEEKSHILLVFKVTGAKVHCWLCASPMFHCITIHFDNATNVVPIHELGHCWYWNLRNRNDQTWLYLAQYSQSCLNWNERSLQRKLPPPLIHVICTSIEEWLSDRQPVTLSLPIAKVHNVKMYQVTFENTRRDIYKIGFG